MTLAPGAFVITVLVLGFWLIADVLLEHVQQRARDLDQLDRHRALMREIRRHDETRS